MQTALAIVIALFASAAPVLADEAEPPSTTRQALETKAVQRFGEDHATCAEWSNGCVICIRAATPSCSRPGIACQPRPAACDRFIDTTVPH